MALVIKVVLVDDCYKFATLIDNRRPVSRDNVGYSDYPHRAIPAEHIDTVRRELPDFKFIITEVK